MPTILLLEDNYGTAEDMRFELKYRLVKSGCEDYHIEECNDIYEADDYLDKLPNEIRVVIADLNMSSDGLTEKEKKDSHGIILTGWVWVKKRFLNEISHPAIIFYSSFIQELEECDDFKNVRDSDNRIYTIPKSQSYDVLCDKVLTILNSEKKHE